MRDIVGNLRLHSSRHESFWPFLHCMPAKTEVDMFFKSKTAEKDTNAAANAAEVVGRMAHQHSVVEQATASPPVPKARTGSCIGSGMSIIGNIECNGAAQVFGRIEGELRASDLLLGNGAQVEGSVIAQEVTVCGRVKGTIRAIRVKLQNGGVVEGDIFHRSLSIDENSQFEGSSRRVKNPIDSLSSVNAKGPRKQDMQSLSPTPLRSIDADLQQVERWFAQSCSQMTS
jgi:cytoskeletal protein CcmA (bactofilin family)